MFSHARLIQPLLSSTIWFIHCSNGIHNTSQGSQTNGSKQGYTNPPVCRPLIVQSHIPPNLSPANPDSCNYVSETRLDSKHEGGQGQTYSRTLTDLKLENS